MLLHPCQLICLTGARHVSVRRLPNHVTLTGIHKCRLLAARVHGGAYGCLPANWAGSAVRGRERVGTAWLARVGVGWYVAGTCVEMTYFRARCNAGKV